MSDDDDLSDIERQLAELEGVELDDEDEEDEDVEEEVQKSTSKPSSAPQMSEEEKQKKLAAIIDQELKDFAAGTSTGELMIKMKEKLEEERGENEQLHSTLDYIKQKYEDLKKSIKEGREFGETAALSDKIRKMQSILEEQEKENIALDKVLVGFQKKQRDLKIACSNFLEDKKQINEISEEFLRTSKDKIASIRTLFEKNIEEIKSKVNRLEEKSAKVEKENLILEKEVIPQLEDQIEQLLYNIASIQSNITKLNSLLQQEMESHFSVKEEKTLRIVNLKADLVEKQQITSSNKEMIESLTKTLRELTKTNQKLQSQFEDLTREETKFDREVTRVKTQMEKLETENADLYKEIRALEKEKRKPRV